MYEDNRKLVTVYSAANRIDALIAQSMLEGEHIQYYVTGDYIQEIAGVGSIGGYNVAFGPVKIQVAEEDADRAREILRPIIEDTEVIDEKTLTELAEQSGDGNPEDG